MIDDPLQCAQIEHGQGVRDTLERARHRFVLLGRPLAGTNGQVDLIFDLGKILADFRGHTGQNVGVGSTNPGAQLLDACIRHEAVIQL